MSNDEHEGKKIKVTVKDKRRTGESYAAPKGAASPGVTPQSRSSESDAPSERRTPAKAQPAGDLRSSSPGFEAEPTAAAPDESAQEPDYLAELQRERADFENYRKRMMREVSSSGVRAKSVLAEKLLPVLDNFERAIAHGEGGEGVALVFRELKTALESEGLEEIEAEGQPFDPNVHEAVMSVDDDGVAEPTVKEVYRRGYRFGEQLLRAAMVVVARPSEHGEVSSEGSEE